MTLHYEDAGLRLFHGSNKDVLGADTLGYPFELGYHPDRLIPDASFDSIVTDPPYELGFMGKGWGSTGIAYDVDMWRECFRVLKPGGYLLAFGGTRTWHRIAVAIEDAGFDVRDSIAWMYGSGFPKSMDVAKAIDKMRDDRPDALVIAAWLAERRDAAGLTNRDIDAALGLSGMAGHWTARADMKIVAVPRWEQWQQLRELIGFGDDMDTEVQRLNARKGEFGETFKAREVTGAVDEWTDRTNYAMTSRDGLRRDSAITGTAAAEWSGWGTALKPAFEPIIVARKPLAGTVAANVLAYGTGAINIDACRVSASDAQLAAKYASVQTAGPRANSVYGADARDRAGAEPHRGGRFPSNVLMDESQATALDDAERGASRYFPTFRYEAKASGAERPEVDGVAHATVKPLDLMRWLVRLVTRRGGHVLDPFAGSGTSQA